MPVSLALVPPSEEASVAESAVEDSGVEVSEVDSVEDSAEALQVRLLEETSQARTFMPIILVPTKVVLVEDLEWMVMVKASGAADMAAPEVGSNPSLASKLWSAMSVCRELLVLSEADEMPLSSLGQPQMKTW